MRKNWTSRGRAAALPLGLLLAACSGGKTVDLGGDEQNLGGEGGRVCDSAGIGRGSFYVGTYDALTKLEGCREIHGSLIIGKLDVPDLTPLRGLQVIDGDLHLGEFPYENVESATPGLVFVPGEGELSEHEVSASSGEVWFPSLAGLGSLESVQGLILEAIGPVDLSELASLRSVELLSVSVAPALTDLRGLESANIQGLALVEVPELVSLNGFQSSPYRLENLYLANAPKLIDIEPLAGIEWVDQTIELTATGLEDLDALSGLGWAPGGITLRSNQALVDATGLDGLNVVKSLVLDDNPRLERLPSLPKLDEIESITITNNEALTEFAPAMPSLELVLDYPGAEYGTSLRIVRISANPRLTRIALPESAAAVVGVFVDRNPSLEELDLGGIESLDALSIAQNASLSRVSARAVQTVDNLTVTDNPLLSLEPFAGLRTFVTVASGNADELAP